MAKFNECGAPEEMSPEAQRIPGIIGNLHPTCIHAHCGLIARLQKFYVEKPIGSVSPELDQTIHISTNPRGVSIGIVCSEALELVNNSPRILRLGKWAMSACHAQKQPYISYGTLPKRSDFLCQVNFNQLSFCDRVNTYGQVFYQ